MEKSDKNPGRKRPLLASVLSLLFVGLGQVYNRQVVKGIGLFILASALTLLSPIPILGLLVVIYSSYDAYATAIKINKDRGISEPAKAGILGMVLVSIVVIWLLMVIGVVLFQLGIFP
ncbi:MAG: hypothetical protein KKA79_10430 [Nanoarchaeota archaeon]|nr:hypothetical protein [Nanoarchaeota archaeon]